MFAEPAESNAEAHIRFGDAAVKTILSATETYPNRPKRR